MFACAAEVLALNDADVADCLTALIATCEDAQHGFRSCAGNAERMDLQLMMTRRAATWHRWSGELRALCVDGVSPGVSRRGWPAEKTQPSGDSDLALLAECESGEENAWRRWRDALEQDLPRVVRAVLQRQVEDIQRSRAQMRSLRAAAGLGAGLLVGRRQSIVSRGASTAD